MEIISQEEIMKYKLLHIIGHVIMLAVYTALAIGMVIAVAAS